MGGTVDQSSNGLTAETVEGTRFITEMLRTLTSIQTITLNVHVALFYWMSLFIYSMH